MHSLSICNSFGLMDTIGEYSIFKVVLERKRKYLEWKLVIMDINLETTELFYYNGSMCFKPQFCSRFPKWNLKIFEK